MALCCIGGVCVPYTAVVPLLILALQWVAAKLAAIGLLPKKVQELMQLPDPSTKKTDDDRDCCCSSPSGPSKVKTLDSQTEFDKLIASGDQIVCKFTATWCKPCHRIQPIYEGISSGYNENSNIHFLTIDVDDFADISSDYKVAMMPTFLVLQGSDIKATYRGSDDAALRTFIKENVGN